MADVPATLLRFGVLDDDDHRAEWIPALFYPFTPLKLPENQACLIRYDRDRVVVRRGGNLVDVSLPVARFRRMWRFGEGSLLYWPNRVAPGEWFSILLRREELARFSEVRWHRAVPFFLRW